MCRILHVSSLEKQLVDIHTVCFGGEVRIIG